MTVFDALYAETYDRLYGEKDYVGECDLIEAAAGRFGGTLGGRTLDIGCGTGGHSLLLAARGHKVTGVDLSPSMLEQARRKALAAPAAQRPEWVCADARTFDAGTDFDLAVMMFAVIGYLTTNADVAHAFANIRRSLKPGALFISDFWYGPSVLTVRPADRRRVLDTDTGQIIRANQTRLDTFAHTAEVSFHLQHMVGGRLTAETRENHTLRYFFPQEYAAFLGRAGFELLSLTAFPSLSDRPTDETWNALAVARAV